MPRASVIVAVKNGAATLQRCLDSAFAQAGADAEVVVIDGASTDGTIAILERNAPRLGHWSSAADSGIYAAWNKGVARSRGEWLCFLGADDSFHDAAALRELLESAPVRAHASRLVYGRINLVTRAGTVVQSAGRPWEAAREDFLAGFMIPTPAVLHHRSLFEEHGPFDESYRIAGDYEFALRELKAHPAAFVDRLVVDMQTGGLSGRPDTIHKALREIVRARAAHGFPDTPPRLRAALATSRLGALLYRVTGRRAFGTLADGYRLLRGKPRIWTA